MYTITALNEDLEKRTFGYFDDLKTALEVVKRDTWDMHECRYSYLLVEKVYQGIPATCEKVQWYIYNLGVWMPCAEPEFGYSINWAMG